MTGGSGRKVRRKAGSLQQVSPIDIVIRIICELVALIGMCLCSELVWHGFYPASMLMSDAESIKVDAKIELDGIRDDA